MRVISQGGRQITYFLHTFCVHSLQHLSQMYIYSEEGIPKAALCDKMGIRFFCRIKEDSRLRQREAQSNIARHHFSTRRAKRYLDSTTCR